MCDFPSWIEYAGSDLFLTDRDANSLISTKWSADSWPYDVPGHHAIRTYFNLTFCDGKEFELNQKPVPPKFIKAIKDGKLNRLMQALGVSSISFHKNGFLKEKKETQRYGDTVVLHYDDQGKPHGKHVHKNSNVNSVSVYRHGTLIEKVERRTDHNIYDYYATKHQTYDPKTGERKVIFTFYKDHHNVVIIAGKDYSDRTWKLIPKSEIASFCSIVHSDLVVITTRWNKGERQIYKMTDLTHSLISHKTEYR